MNDGQQDAALASQLAPSVAEYGGHQSGQGASFKLSFCRLLCLTSRSVFTNLDKLNNRVAVNSSVVKALSGKLAPRKSRVLYEPAGGDREN